MRKRKKFKSFHETYKLITFALTVAMIYPNPRTEKYRIIYILFTALVVGSIAPLALAIFIDMYKCWREDDIINIIRHSTVVGPFLGGLFKMVLMFHKRVQAKQIMDEITRDHLLYNDFSEKYKEIARAGIHNSQRFSEKWWAVTVIFCVMTFPVMAISLNFYNHTFKSEPTKYMIHDLRLPNTEAELRFKSPYFELIFVYMVYCSFLYVVNFIGYDGFFGLSINHACIKMEMYCAALEDAFKADEGEVFGRVVGVIKEQCRMFRYIELIQDTFNIWLGIIFIATMIQICTCLYHITEGYGFDLRYLIFVTGAVIHIYLPCRYAAKLKVMSLETSNKIYCSGWEQVDDQRVRRLIMFMIARTQITVEITAFGMLAFDMELFVSILQSSYSMFTLLRS
ncbi:odorant receptor 10-like [Anticarsia gemmatalis]|uniref:odorant receptor 10-like n=1 Tax=Anticarsia gemmatalis TaxID=129554 RepID=UPI003F75AFDD